MEPKIVTKPAFSVVGMMYFGKNENNDIPQVWQKLMARVKEIDRKSWLAYGVCSEMEEDGRFHYMAGFEIEDETDIPTGMESWNVAEQTYAVFPCTLQTIGETYHRIFETWLPQSEYEKADGPDFELYHEDFDPETGTGMSIYMPVK